MRPLVLEIHPFPKSLSSAVDNGSWQEANDPLTRGQCLNLIGLDFFIFGPFLCHMTELHWYTKW